jgi:hypothetical protein
MTPARKVLLVLYVAIMGPLFVDYIMGFGWFHGYENVLMPLLVIVAYGIATRMKSRADEKTQGGDALVEALDTEGAVHSDPKARRFIQQVVAVTLGLLVLIVLGVTHRHRGQGQLGEDALVLLLMIGILAWVLRRQFGNISQVESDDGVTLTLLRRGQTMHVPWSQVESVEVSRPHGFWQVVIRFRLLGESKVEAVRFMPLGWRKMTPATAEKLKLALDARRMAR